MMVFLISILWILFIFLFLFSCYRSERDHYYYFMKRYCSYFNLPIPSFSFYFWCCWFSSPSFCERYLKKHPEDRDCLDFLLSSDRDKKI